MVDGAGSFPRGFLLSVEPVEPPAHFVPGPVLPHFAVHPLATVEHAADPDGTFVVILGTCVPTDTDGAGGTAAEVLLGALRSSEDAFLTALDRFAGRHVVLYGRGESVRVVTDATAMRSVFYASDGRVVGSHALLVERALGGHIERDKVPFWYGYPGNRTPYARTRLLTANTLYDLTAGEVRRFWPTRQPQERSVEDAAAETLARATTALRNVARQRPVKLALTAGLDSRALLAVVLRSGIDVECYTYGSGPDTAVDRAFAADLAREVGLRHTVVPTARPDGDLAAALSEAHYGTHHRTAVGPLREWTGDPSTAALTANLLEIGRSFFKAHRGWLEPPVTGRAMAALYHRVIGARGKERIREFGEEEFLAHAAHGFDELVAVSDLASVEGLIDPFDQFYWEHRMSAWHGTSMLERDFYAEAFIPFNARVIFTAMLGVTRAERDRGAVLRRLIEMVDERLLSVPINPKEWPPRTPGDEATVLAALSFAPELATDGARPDAGLRPRS